MGLGDGVDRRADASTPLGDDMSLRRIAALIGVGVLGLATFLFVIWSIAIGPVAVWRILTHGTTTVWDHLEYPGRSFAASDDPRPWAQSPSQPNLLPITIDGVAMQPEQLFSETQTLAFVVIHDGALAYEWNRPGHGPDEPSMLFSVTKSVLSLLVGTAIDDGIITSVTDPVTDYVPELADAGFGELTIEDLLRMDSGLAYVEDDNPFGIHVEFNYTAELEHDILALRLLDTPDEVFRYKSGDNALVGLVLDRALGDESITDYFHRRLWAPLGAEVGGIWSTDHENGLERTWCCLAVTSRDLARLGQLVLQEGRWQGRELLDPDWLDASFQPAYQTDRWPDEYADSPLKSYGYQWWLTGSSGYLALGKNGQYLYIDPVHEVVIVRLGESQGDVSWLAVFEQVAPLMGRGHP